MARLFKQTSEQASLLVSYCDGSIDLAFNFSTFSLDLSITGKKVGVYVLCCVHYISNAQGPST